MAKPLAAREVESFLVSAYDCAWCVPLTAGAGPVTHYKDGQDARYAEHWLSRIEGSLRPVLTYVIPRAA